MRSLGRILAPVVGLTLLGAPAAAATTITVNTTSDTVANDGSCSLREAITATDTGAASGTAAGECPGGAGNDMIVVPRGTYTLVHGKLSISGSVTIAGAGATSTTIDGSGSTDRVFEVTVSGVVALTGVTITGGHAPDGAMAVSDTPGNPGQPGGGIRNDGVLSLTGVTVTGNHAGNGSTGGTSILANTHPGGPGGGGGGIYNTGTLTLDRSAVSLNQAGDGGAGNQAVQLTGNGGPGGFGGGILSTAGATLTVTDTAVSANHAGSGGPGPDAAAVPGSGGDGGRGGGIWTGGSLTITGSTIAANAAGDGGQGGGVSNGSQGGGGGMGADGGGLFDSASDSQTISNDTIAGNTAGTGGNGGRATVSSGQIGGNAGSGGGGGGVVSGGATLVLIGVTVASDLVGDPGASGTGTAPGGPGNPGDPGKGGGVAAYGSATLQDTIIANNTGTNCNGATTDDGHNLSFPDNQATTLGDCVGTNANPRLGPLHNNGGPTQTMALEPGSVAIDQVPATGAGCPATDQRGVQRPQGPSCDIGAFEAAVAPGNTAPPAVTGLASVGSKLACSPGAWTNFPQSYAYEWRQDGVAIGSARTATYVVSVADGGHALTCHVTATNQAGSASADSAAVSVPVAPGGSGGPGGTRTPPKISSLAVHPSAFPAAAHGASIAVAKGKPKRKPRKTGTTVTYRDSLSASTKFTVLRAELGMRTGRGCLAPSRRAHRPKRCTRYVVVGSFIHDDRASSIKFHFSGRIDGHALLVGSYKLTAVARAGRLTGKAVGVRFRVID